MATNEANVYYQLPIVRVTALTVCGVPKTTCASITDACIVSIEETGEYRDRQEFFPENGAGVFCMEKTNPPRRKWLNLTITFNDTNPKMIGIITGDTVNFNDAVTPEAIGYSVDQNAIVNSNFALEGWLNLGSRCSGAECDAVDPNHGYVVYPWVKEATIGDITYQNDVATFVVNAIAVRNSPWGQGPYNVVNSAAVATLGAPLPLFTAIASTQYKRMIFTTMAPPTAQCDCIDLVPLLAFAPGGGGLHPGTVTFPTLAGSLPADINWGDASPVQTVTSGTTAVHNYAAGGTYTVTFKPRDTSSATYVSAATVIA